MDAPVSAVGELADMALEAYTAGLADVADQASVQAMVDEVMQHYGQIDILVNIAGVANAGQPGDVPLDDWKHVVDINLTGVILYVDGGWTAW